MKRVKVINHNGSLTVIEEIATVLSNNDVVIDSESYEVIQQYKSEQRFQAWFNTLPKWLKILVKTFKEES